MVSEKTKYSSVDASPVKSFFVNMLTRDISLGDAILDLLDNCVDGILRTGEAAVGDKPYLDYKAEISFDENSFIIHDNCGGIPWGLHEYAFRMGRIDNHKEHISGSVGVYGIGMKRAIFKIGKHCLITTKNKGDEYEVEILPDWMSDESDWKIPVRAVGTPISVNGTTIVIGELRDEVAERFGPDLAIFEKDFIEKIESHYAFIINKGFEVTVNKKPVVPKPIKLVFVDPSEGEPAIRPFVYKGHSDGVDFFLAVGFTRPIPGQEEILEEQEKPKYSSLEAGWTVTCNDRIVIYCDRTELTGWGEAGVPRYHTQFIAISGVVEFKADDPSKLPTTTTKRGIEASSALYLQVKNKMREGMSIFTDYTNKWKTNIKESKAHIIKGKTLTVSQIRESTAQLEFSTVRRGIGGSQHKPRLPLPSPDVQQRRRIAFSKQLGEIQTVSEYLFDKEDASPSIIGERCFDEILTQAES